MCYPHVLHGKYDVGDLYKCYKASHPVDSSKVVQVMCSLAINLYYKEESTALKIPGGWIVVVYCNSYNITGICDLHHWSKCSGYSH